MSDIHISTVRLDHVYTRSRTPWKLDERSESPASRLSHYLSGGGMSFGRSVRQEEADQKRTRFLVVAGVFGLAWFVLLVF